LDVVSEILKPTGVSIEKVSAHGKTPFYDKIIRKKNNATTKLPLYSRICVFLVSHGLATAYRLEHEFTQRILNDLISGKNSSKLVAFEKYVEKNCIDKPKLKTLQEVKQKIEGRKKKELAIVPYAKILENIGDYTRLFERAFKNDVNGILDIIQDIWSKPKNKNIKVSADGKAQVYEEVFDEEDEDKVIGHEWSSRTLKNVATNILIAIQEKLNDKEFDEYLKDKENLKYMIGRVGDLLGGLVGDAEGGKMKLEKVPRRYK
jgi:hypothetical protein